MGLDQHRVRIDVEEGVDRAEMARRLQDPALAGVARLHVLQEAEVMAIGRPHVLLEQPLVVGRDVEAHLEADAHELGRGRDDAFLGHQRADGMDRLEARRELVDLVEALLGPLDAGVGVIGRGLGRRTRVVDLPGEGGAVSRILGEQAVEQRRPGPWKAHDEERAADRLPGDLGMAGAPVGEDQAMGQQLQQMESVSQNGQSSVEIKSMELDRLTQRRNDIMNIWKKMDDTFDQIMMKIWR